ncbi:MAG: hypothetical protein KAS39_05965, partial [Actinomycetia bacterium]|nr:hypothetical protein [Actinomycetes bacterium]
MLDFMNKEKAQTNKSGFKHQLNKELMFFQAKWLSINKYIRYFIEILILGTLLFFSIQPALYKSWIAPGADTPSYLITTKFIIDSFMEKGSLPFINPNWYCGFEILHSSPPFVYLPLCLIYFFFRDIMIAGEIAHYVFFIGIGLAGFFALKKKYSTLPALISAFIFSTSPFIFGIIPSAGSYTRGLSFLLGILSFYFVQKIAEKGLKEISSSIMLIILFSLIFLSHPMNAVVFIICWTFYYMFLLLLKKELSVLRIFHWIAVCFLSLPLTAWYLLPFFTEKRSWMVLPMEVFEMYSVVNFVPRSIYEFGWPLLSLALIGIVIKWKEPEARAFILTGLLAALFSLGVYFPIYKVIPIFRSVYPSFFLFFLSFALSYLAAGTVEFILQKKGVKLFFLIPLLVSILVFTFFNSRTIASTCLTISDENDIAISNTIDEMSNKGRMMVIKPGFGYLLFNLSYYTDKPMVEGMYYSISPLGKHLAWMYDAIR